MISDRNLTLIVSVLALAGGTAGGDYLDPSGGPNYSEWRSYFSDPSPSVITTAVKRAEDDEGVIYRCYEAEGSEASLELQCFQSLKRAERVDFIEDSKGAADVQDGVLSDTLPPFRIANYKLWFDAP